MQIKFIKIITSISLIMILFIQLIWLNNSINLIKEISKEELNHIIQDAVEKEALIRLKSTPKGTRIETPKAQEKLHGIVYLLEGLDKLDYPIDLLKVDSIVNQQMKNNQLYNELNIVLTDSSNQTILKQSKDKYSSYSWNTIESDFFPITIDNQQGVKLIVHSPYNVILDRLILTIISTFILCILSIYGLFRLGKLVVLFENQKDFSYSMVHNLITPLNTIKMCTSSLQSGKFENNIEYKNKYYSIILKNVKKLLSISDQNLFIYALENGINNIEKKEIELTPIINDQQELYKTNYDENIQFNINLSCKKIIANQQILYDIISNLLDNSIKYSKKDIIITITSYSNHRYDIIKIHDNGIGIKSEDLSTIFKKFKRVSKNKHTCTGLGLGLNFVYQAMKVHNGFVEVNSQIGQYSEFVLYFPKKRKHD